MAEYGQPSPAHDVTGQVILFDGVCNLCNGFVQFIIPRDPNGRFKLAALQSTAGATLLAGHAPANLPDSVVLVADGRVYVRSDAVLRIAGGLKWPWPLLLVFRLVPGPVRDWLYDLVARKRYRWFGQRDVCMVPDRAIMSRFLD